MGNATVHETLEAFQRAWNEGRRLDAARLLASVDDQLAPDAQRRRDIALLLMEGGDLQSALVMYDRALALDAHSVVAWTNRGNILQRLERLPDSMGSYERALALDPQFAIAWNNLGNSLTRVGRLTDAERAYQAALAADPDLHDVRTNLATVLSSRGDMAQAQQLTLDNVQRRPTDHAALFNYLYFLNFSATRAPADIAAEHRRFGAQLQQQVCAQAPLPPLTRAVRRDRPLRVGYVSPNLHHHSCSYFLEPIFRMHDRAHVAVYAYANMVRHDDMTATLQSYPVTWRSIYGVDTAAACAQIRADEIDILVDCAGHTEGNRLDIFCCRAAPIQVTYLGYPNTTGVPAMDARIIDAATDPEGSEAYATERLIRLPHGFLCFGWAQYAAQVAGQTPLYQPTPHIRFASFNNLSKTTPDVIACWARILHAVPQSTLLLKNRSFTDAGTRVRYEALLAGHGIAAERVQCVAWDDNRTTHLLRYAAVDIALDTFPYNGTTTTCEALGMGVPVVALAGDRHGARVGVSLLTHAGCPQWIAATPDDYVRIAAALAADRAALAQWHATLPQHFATSPLCDAARFTRELEAAYASLTAE